MALKTLTLLLAATGVALTLYRLGQRPAPTGSAPTLRQRLRDMTLASPGIDTANADHEDLLTPPPAST
jgi:hypothetical protein